ncbi:hypothetical protein [Novosphingobium sp. MD-1]|uniref:hypothetical protein n=1 Tax=Novosphingobium sp. MD-1 TaxID=1630648 RepID=UPI001F163A97|nr:hypothetical protein [Novosphingobium sp. MD-1]
MKMEPQPPGATSLAASPRQGAALPRDQLPFVVRRECLSRMTVPPEPKSPATQRHETQAAHALTSTAKGIRRSETDDDVAWVDHREEANPAQEPDSHQNTWRAEDRPHKAMRKELDALPVFHGRSRSGWHSDAYRQRQMDAGLVPVRLLLHRDLHRMVIGLRDRYGYRSLHAIATAYLEAAEKRVNIASLVMPRRHSRSTHYVECNVMISEDARNFLDRIKSRHGLSRYHAFEALLDALPDPWAVKAHGSLFDCDKPENAVSG